MEHILFNDGRVIVIHRCFVHNDKLYTQEKCNIDTTVEYRIEPINLSTMYEITDTIKEHSAIMCANCFPISEEE